MTKHIQLKLLKIRYGGDSIGDDIRVEIDCLGHSLDLNKKIKRGGEVILGAPVGNFFTDQTSFSLPLSIRVIERDLIFNDIGSAEETFVVNTRSAALQSFTAITEVLEKRNYRSKKKALFEIMFEAVMSDAIMYVKFQNGGDGWLEIIPEKRGDNFSIPYHTKVRLEKEEGGRQYFTILEGGDRGTRASVTLDADGSSFLQAENPHTAPVHFVYSLSTRILKLKTKRYKTIDYKSDKDPWERRLYDIAIPDAPHKGGRAYLDRAALALVWFKVSHRDDKRYLHPGKYTAGCITLTEIERWDELCGTILKARRGDGRSVGVVEITN